jgi:hypothetical protein
VPTIILLTYAVYRDIIERLVSDYIWWIGAFLGIIGNLLFFFLFNEGIQLTLVQLIINIVVALVICVIIYSPKYFWGIGILGEADLFAFLTISILMPVRFNPNPYNAIILSTVPVIFDVICNSFIFMAFFMIGLFLRNVIYLLRGNTLFSDSNSTIFMKLFVMVSGVKIKSEKLSNFKNINILEKFSIDDEELDSDISDASGEWVIVPDFSYEEKFSQEQLIQIKDQLISSGKNQIWITFLAPFLVFILLSAIISPWSGNLVFRLLETFFN